MLRILFVREVLVRIAKASIVSSTIGAVGACGSSNAPASTSPPPRSAAAPTSDARRMEIEIGVSCAADPASCPKNDVDQGAPATPTCDPLSGPGVVRRGNGISPVATTPQQCAACKGSWGPHGIAQVVGCLCSTPDADRSCSSPLDCEAECIVLDPNARDLARKCPALNAKFAGTCSSVYVGFGCLARVVEQPTPQGPLRQLQWSCLD